MKTWKIWAQKLLIIHNWMFFGSSFRAAHTAENWFPVLEIRLRHSLFFLLCDKNIPSESFLIPLCLQFIYLWFGWEPVDFWFCRGPICKNFFSFSDDFFCSKHRHKNRQGFGTIHILRKHILDPPPPLYLSMLLVLKISKKKIIIFWPPTVCWNGVHILMESFVWNRLAWGWQGH